MGLRQFFGFLAITVIGALMGAFFSNVWPFAEDKIQVLRIEPDSLSSLLPAPTLLPSLFSDTASNTPSSLAPTSQSIPSPAPVTLQLATVDPTATVTPIPIPVQPDSQTALPASLKTRTSKPMPDPYLAKQISNSTGEHYQVIDTTNGRVVLTTKAQFPTRNDVKSGQFNSDFTQFAALYHYGHDGNYSWIGVWSTATGEHLHHVKRQGHTTSLETVFNK